MAEIAPTPSPAHIRHGSSIGQPLTRRDGVLKVTGTATYAADNHPAGMLYAVLAVSSVAAGVLIIGRQPLINLSGILLSPWQAAVSVALAWVSVVVPVFGFTALGDVGVRLNEATVGKRGLAHLDEDAILTPIVRDRRLPR